MTFYTFSFQSTATGANGDHSENAAKRAVVVSPLEGELATALHLSVVVLNVLDLRKINKNATLENAQVRNPNPIEYFRTERISKNVPAGNKQNYT